MTNISYSQKEIVNNLLKVEHKNYAATLGLVDAPTIHLERKELAEAISVVDRLSRNDQEFAKRVAILTIALSWEYSNKDYKDSLREIFVTALTRMGIAPSTVLVDEGYKNEGIYSPFGSYISKLSVIANQLKYEVDIYDKTYLLTDFQKNVWDSIDTNKVVCISAPTSAGKSFSIYLKIIQKLTQEYKSVVYVVPTISLVNQVTKDLSNLVKEFNFRDVEIYTHIQEKQPEKYIYVLTQERAISGFSEEAHFQNLDMLIVDEVQNIERVANDGDQRSKILYDFLKEIKHHTNTKRIILSGPRLKNVGNLGFDIFDQVSYQAETKVPPVVNITYSVSKCKGRFYFNQYSDISEEPSSIIIQHNEQIKGLGGTLYNDNFHSYLDFIIGRIKNKSNLIFSPTANQARKTAIYLANNAPVENREQVESLAEYIAEFVHKDYDLVGLVRHGVAYHTGKLPLHIRSAIEDSFSSGIVNNIVCTTTLMQGVNFPASNIIVRNPYLFTRRIKDRENVKLSNYEFSNLRGRAGRLLKEFIGRTIVLDESSFEIEQENEALFEFTEKELSTGYSEYYERFRENIDSAIGNDAFVEDGKEKYLVTYIRQTIYRHGENSYARLQEVGINMSREQIQKNIKTLDSLSVPPSVVYKNRYWDPYDLEVMYQRLKNNMIVKLPDNIWHRNTLNSLKSAAITLSQIMPYYFNRYISNPTKDSEQLGKYIWSICKYATDWGREKLLRDILRERDFTDDASDQIDNAVKIITSKVCFGLPMLLKPLSDMSEGENSILSVIENGAHTKVTKYLIAKGIPRDTAIYIKQTALADIDQEEPDHRQIQKKISDLRGHVSPWIFSQIESAGM
ncbi:DEAD/DEAH box helicase [Salinicola salarius]|uniref:DEAD/DEAH box helicase n=1 Tax=Salinicola salarius TaxID=430457 RepID=UPI000DA1C732|nr:DEAD/DEAH box helicase [Salinicola salarius]